MNENEMIDDIVAMLDGGIDRGTGHVNVIMEDDSTETRNVETMGCTDCSRTPLACSVPTLSQGLDDYK